eukprot:5282221-Amphidinium_carterae.1
MHMRLVIRGDPDWSTDFWGCRVGTQAAHAYIALHLVEAQLLIAECVCHESVAQRVDIARTLVYRLGPQVVPWARWSAASECGAARGVNELSTERSPIVEYGTAIWQFDSMMASLSCPGMDWPLLQERCDDSCTKLLLKALGL